MSYRIEEIEGIGAAYAGELAGAGIKNTDELLEKCGSAKGREAVARATGLDAGQLLKWANMADLMRVSGIGREFSELLEAAGVDTVKELRNRRPQTLVARMAEVNDVKRLTRRVPSTSEVARWVQQAETLEPKITH
jgi:predicted flap endonuclease-1-like 5' DNA nuclease